MNKTVLGWSGVLVALVPVSFLLPAPLSWLCPVFAFGSWALLAWGGLRPPPRQEPVVEAVTEAPPRVVVETREVVPPPLVDHLGRLQVSLDVVRGLKALVVSDTQAAVLRLTDALFNLVKSSKEVSANIEKSLAFITDGDSGLGRTVSNLEAQVRVFETLAAHFRQLKEGLSSDLGALGEAVGSINAFSDTLSDLADQTNVLAINASIEAARVGIHGRGFAVIATQVQNLAKNSKSISDTMARTVRDVVGNVEASFGRQTARIAEAGGLIEASEEELRRWAAHVGPQLAEVEAMIDDSRRLAAVVTGEIDDVTVSLQFEDRTKQVLDHLIGVLDEAAAFAGSVASPSSGRSKDEAHAAASRHFTVKEEWSLVEAKGAPSGHKSVELF